MSVSKYIKNESKSENPEEDARNRKFGKNQGIANKSLHEPQPTYEKAGSEKIEKGRNNTYKVETDQAYYNPDMVEKERLNLAGLI